MIQAQHAPPFDGRTFARRLTTAPGVYRMFSADDSVLYVGKAASLRHRVASYFTRSVQSPRIASMVAQIARVEVIATRTASEALILENQLIKSLKPRYNVMLRDDKSYPYIVLTQETWPRIAFHRGPRRLAGRYFGPYSSVGAVRETLNLMQKLFRLRSCEDSVFRNRSRPCLQHQIGRCSAPCVGLIEPHRYDDSVRQAGLFLEGRSDVLAQELTTDMERASAALAFEEAARLRDLVGAVRNVQSRQYVDGEEVEMDVLACELAQGAACLLLLAFRNGMNHGTRAFFPKLNGATGEDEVLAAFITQYYLELRPPREIVLSHALEDRELLEAALSEQAGRKVEIKPNVRGDRARYLDLAKRNAALALAQQIGSSASQRVRVESLQELLGMNASPKRMECFDISHTMGEATVASCVVFDVEGPVRAQYRRYNIAGITPGDDYAAMRQALERRFRGAQIVDGAQRDGPEVVLPDVLLIDGGQGQLAQAMDVLNELGVHGVELLGVAKGEERRAGDETLIRPDGSSLRPGAESPALQLIQQLRDESHRFAITGHRGRRQKARDTSSLEDIPGIGPRRRASLLRHFGGLTGLKNAGVEDIARVAGIDAALAGRIYAALHGLSESGRAPPQDHAR
ncbi:MAG TPA: excinuclease ABC subunit UvrC [Xanthomonadaceae bacterium]|nr:excinuclease ABC subunit UvrC [Xanthomonadaceae bacterium]